MNSLSNYQTLLGRAASRRVRQVRWAFLFLAATFVGCSDSPTVPVPGTGIESGEPWKQYATPEEAGFSSSLLEEARAYAESNGSGAVMVIHAGRVVAAWGDVERKFRCHSVRKSFLSALYGDAVSGGEIDLDATLADLGIDDIEPLSETEKTARVRDLLRASSGVYHRAAKETPEMDQFRPERGSHAPGTHFWYNNWDFNTAGTIYERATGNGIFDAFEDQIARPTGMQDFSIDDTFYEYLRSNSRYPAYAFRMSTRDMAKFGLLFLQQGVWNGQTVLPEAWIAESTSAQAHAREGVEYGYMWWVYPPGNIPHHPELRAFTATGSGGQHILVIPEADVVIVHRGDTDFGRGVRGNVIWQLEGMILSAKVSAVRENPTLGSLESRPWSSSLPTLDLPRRVVLDPETLDRYLGVYRVAEAGVDFIVSRHEDVLVGAIPGVFEVDFLPASETEFFPGLDRVVVRFKIENQRVTGLTLITSDGNYQATRVTGG